MTVRRIVDLIPPVLRPLVFLVAPLLLLHAIFLRTPDVIPPPLPPEITERAAPAVAENPPGLGTDQIRALIEQSDEFKAARSVSCPAIGTLAELERNALYRGLRSAGYLNEPVSMDGTVRVDLTPNAYHDLGADLQEDARTISVVIARKVLLNVGGTVPPPQALPPPLRFSTRGDFTWRWSEANRLAIHVDFVPTATGLSGAAYFQREPNLLWTLARIEFSDPTEGRAR